MATVQMILIDVLELVIRNIEMGKTEHAISILRKTQEQLKKQETEEAEDVPS